jgi:5-methylthioadenosine/S-adenosylhomocysteine deaminase
MRRLWFEPVLVAAVTLVAVPLGQAREPLRGGVLLRGTVVTMDARDRVIRDGRVLVRGHRIVAVWHGRKPPKGVHVRQAVVVAPPGALIFPGLINLHDHPSWSVLPPWPAPSSDAQPAFGRPLGTEPYANRYQWNGNGGFADAPPEQTRLISEPHERLTSSLGLTSEAVKWAEIRGLLGGQTAEQGAGPDPATDASLARDVDNVNFGGDRVETETFPGPDPGLVARERAGAIDAFIAHVAEGVPDALRRPGDSYSSRSELEALRREHLLNDEAVIIHGTALERSDFAAMRHAGSPRDDHSGDGLGAKLVWSPLSNLLLYSRTANVYEALAEGVTVSLGTDWSPSGSANLLEELKVADITLRDGSLLGPGRDLVPRLRSDKALDRELVAMVTRNPARTLRWQSRVGSMTKGKLADLVMITTPRRGSVYRRLIDATDQDVHLTMVGGDPLAGDPAVMRRLKGSDFEAVTSARLGFTKAIDVTQRGVPKGDESFAAIQAALRAALEQEAIQLSPILPEDDHFRFRVIEGARDALGEIADGDPPFALYPSNVNQVQPGGDNPFRGFEARWYAAR